MENKLKPLENSISFIDNPDNNEKLDKIYQEKTIRSNGDWYNHDEKFVKSFLNLGKSLADQNQSRNILIGNIEVNNQKVISSEIYLYYKNLLSERQDLSKHGMDNYLNAISKFPQLSNEQSVECEKCVTEKELSEALKFMPNHLMINFLEMMALLKNFLKRSDLIMYLTLFW